MYLQCFTCKWFQRCFIFLQLNKILLLFEKFLHPPIRPPAKIANCGVVTACTRRGPKCLILSLELMARRSPIDKKGALAFVLQPSGHKGNTKVYLKFSRPESMEKHMGKNAPGKSRPKTRPGKNSSMQAAMHTKVQAKCEKHA